MIARDALANILDAGARAPSFFNMQPWRAHVSSDAITLSVDRARAGSLLDQRARVSLFAIGAFVENAVRAAHALGVVLDATVVLGDDPFDTRVHLTEHGSTSVDPAILAQVLKRDTNRAVLSSPPLDEASLAPFTTPASSVLRFHVVDGEKKASLGEIFGLAAAVVNFQERLWTEQRGFMRLTPDDAARTADGIDLETLPMDDAGRAFMRSLDSFAKVESTLDPEVIARQATAAVVASSHVVVLTTTAPPDARVMVEAGRVFEAAWIDACARGVAMHPTGVLGLFSLVDDAALDTILDADGASDIRGLIDAARDTLGLDDGERLVFAARLSRGGPWPVRSLRRPYTAFTTFDP